jgi:hypothetical protein
MTALRRLADGIEDPSARVANGPGGGLVKDFDQVIVRVK